MNAPASNAFVAERIEKRIAATRPKYDTAKIRGVPSAPILMPVFSMIPPPSTGPGHSIPPSHLIAPRVTMKTNSPAKATTVERAPHHSGSTSLNDRRIQPENQRSRQQADVGCHKHNINQHRMEMDMKLRRIYPFPGIDEKHLRQHRYKEDNENPERLRVGACQHHPGCNHGQESIELTSVERAGRYRSQRYQVQRGDRPGLPGFDILESRQQEGCTGAEDDGKVVCSSPEC